MQKFLTHGSPYVYRGFTSPLHVWSNPINLLRYNPVTQCYWVCSSLPRGEKLLCKEWLRVLRSGWRSSARCPMFTPITLQSRLSQCSHNVHSPSDQIGQYAAGNQSDGKQLALPCLSPSHLATSSPVIAKLSAFPSPHHRPGPPPLPTLLPPWDQPRLWKWWRDVQKYLRPAGETQDFSPLFRQIFIVSFYRKDQKRIFNGQAGSGGEGGGTWLVYCGLECEQCIY